MRGEGGRVAKVGRGDRVRATLEEGALRRDKGDAWRRRDTTEATRDEGVGTRGHVHGSEEKGQQRKKKKEKRRNRWLQHHATRAMRRWRRAVKGQHVKRGATCHNTWRRRDATRATRRGQGNKCDAMKGATH